MSTLHPTPEWRAIYAAACRNISAFVVEQAEKTAADRGFGWIATPDAPDTYDKLGRAHEWSVATGQALPVSSLYCDDVIYSKPWINHAMRYWHDTLHVSTALTFDLDDELELGLKHLDIAHRAGISRNSLEWDILRVDLLGQNYLLGIARRFPLNQGNFVMGCLLHGLDEGVLLEARLTV